MLPTSKPWMHRSNRCTVYSQNRTTQVSQFANWPRRVDHTFRSSLFMSLTFCLATCGRLSCVPVSCLPCRISNHGRCQALPCGLKLHNALHSTHSYVYSCNDLSCSHRLPVLTYARHAFSPRLSVKQTECAMSITYHGRWLTASQTPDPHSPSDRPD